ncbi:helix-turn-helix domain-containing protein [Ruegeria sp.]|uniref:helix-turn-helix domain-containing protein n=1 Tax=Ruegeria sp. TaxID=1879320 RepID=UPI003C7AE138
MTDSPRDPAELRIMFGENLKQLAEAYPSISELCRQLGINRTQFNRYLSGESFPRPDILDRICRFFHVDARILLEPLDEIGRSEMHPAGNILDRFIASQAEPALVPGFYHATESIPDDPSVTSHRLLLIRKIGHCTLLRAFEPRRLLPHSPARDREIQGIVSSSGNRIFALMSRRGARDSRMMVLSPQARGSELRGHVLSLTGNKSATSTPNSVTLRHLGNEASAALNLARSAPLSPI